MQIVEILEEDRARAVQGDTGSASIEVDVSLIDEPAAGDFVIVHAGYAIERLESDDALERIDLLTGNT